MPDVRVVRARCARGRGGFGMRVARGGEGRWLLTWAFPLREAVAGREGYGRAEITGRFDFAPEYPGCPHCGDASFVRCGGCGEIACWDSLRRAVTCPWCGATTRIEGTVDRLGTAGDR